MGKWADTEFNQKEEAKKDRIWFYSWLIPLTAFGTVFMKWLAKVFFRRKEKV